MILKLVSKYWYQISLSILVVITIASLIPLPELPKVPGSDKTHHFLAYGALIFPVALRSPKYWPWLAVFFLAWSGAIELIQPFVNRYGEWLDLLANAGGLAIGLTLGLLIKRIYFAR